ncbi:NifB/NifX family molybdenum-iron cluster-binding protein [bacterium]|nr:NifB/NifX family molybdenum-iron cluster-binding protein [bacterium]
MRTAAFAFWEDRIAPVFDVARQVRVVREDGGRILDEKGGILDGAPSVRKALQLSEMGIDTLVCGAISRTLYDIVASYGIRVIPFVAGDIREIIRAWMNGTLDGEAFTMPGCRHRMRRWFHHASGTYGGNRRKTGGGAGMGLCMGRSRGGRGRGKTEPAGRPDGF